MSGFFDKGHGDVVGFYSPTLAGVQMNLVVFQPEGGCRENRKQFVSLLSLLALLCASNSLS